MKKIVALFIILECVCINVLQAQEKPKLQKILAGKYTPRNPRGTYYNTITRVNDHIHILSCMDRRIYGLFGSRGAAIYTLNHTIEDYNIVTKRSKKVEFPKELSTENVDYVGKMRGKDEVVKYLFKQNVWSEKRNALIALEYDQKIGKFTNKQVLFEGPTQKMGLSILEYFDRKDAGFKVYVNENQGMVAIVDYSTNGRGKDPTFNYVVKNYEGDIINFGEKIKADIDRFANCLITPNGGIFVTQYPKRIKQKGEDEWENSLVLYKNGEEKVIDIAQKFTGYPRIFYSGSKVMIACTYGEEIGEYSGVYVAELSENTASISNEKYIDVRSLNITSTTERTSARANRRSERRNKSYAESAYNVLTTVRVAPNGDITLLVERHYTYTEVVTTSNGRGSVSTRTIPHFVYGPGVVHCIDPTTLSHKNYAQFVYKIDVAYIDPGTGMEYIAAGNDIIYTRIGTSLYRHTLNNESKTVANDEVTREERSKLRNARFKSIDKLKWSSMFVDDDKFYLLTANINEFKVDVVDEDRK
ncbi:MAG: hypothetical protein RL660_2817 [Bacteroidota bacterium]|jgi:hypothetical protein